MNSVPRLVCLCADVLLFRFFLSCLRKKNRGGRGSFQIMQHCAHSNMLVGQETSEGEIHKLSPAAIRANLAELYNNEIQMGFSSWQAAVVSALAAPLCKAEGKTQLDELLELIVPFRMGDSSEEPSPFALEPSLATSMLSSADRARVLQKILIHETMVPLVSKGEKTVELVLHLARKIVDMNSKKGRLDDVLGIAIENLSEIALAFVALGSRVTGELGSEMLHVSNLMDSMAGSMSLMKKAVVNQAFWRGRETEYRKYDMASRTMLPELTRCTEGLRKNDWSCLKESIDMIAHWRNSMRPGSTEPLQELILAKASERLAELSVTGDLLEHGQLLDKASMVMPSHSGQLRDLAAQAREKNRISVAAGLSKEILQKLEQFTQQDRISQHMCLLEGLVL